MAPSFSTAVAQRTERNSAKVVCAGSSPAGRAKFKRGRTDFPKKGVEPIFPRNTGEDESRCTERENRFDPFFRKIGSTPFTERWSNDRTRGSDPRNRGSTPRRSTNQGRLMGMHTCLVQTQVIPGSNPGAATNYTQFVLSALRRF